MTIPVQTSRPWSLEAEGLLVGGSLLGIATTVHVMVFPDPLATEAVELFVTVGMSLVLVYSGYWLRTNDVDVETVRSLAQWTVASAAATGLMFVWFLLHQWLSGGGVNEPLFVILSSASGGAAVGFVTGVCNVGAFDSWIGQRGSEGADRPGTTPTRESSGAEPGSGRWASLDALFASLGSRRARYTLYYLYRTGDGVATFDEVADRIVRWEGASSEGRPAPESVRIDLHHSVVPKLGAVGLLDYDPRSRTIRYWSDPLVEQWLARTAPHDLPDEPA